jgi:hypothetical protein
MSWRVEYRIFHGSRQYWNGPLDEATEFASQVSSEMLIGITHAFEKDDAVVAVWCWAEGSYWTCPRCGERIEDQFDSCWSCSTPKTKPAAPNPSQEAQGETPPSDARNCHLEYKLIRGAYLEWDDFFSEAAKLASAIGPERLIGIAHSGGKDDALATVFYWSEDADAADTA